MDASIRFKTSDITPILEQAHRLGVSVARTWYMLSMHVHPAMFNYFQISQQCQLASFYEVSGAFVVLKNDTFVHNAILDPWVACAFSSDCMCPSENGTKDCRTFLRCTMQDDPYFRCHRFDQAALTIILAGLFDREMTALLHGCAPSQIPWYLIKRKHDFTKYFPDV